LPRRERSLDEDFTYAVSWLRYVHEYTMRQAFQALREVAIPPIGGAMLNDIAGAVILLDENADVVKAIATLATVGILAKAGMP
jgi:hypothetical protein